MLTKVVVAYLILALVICAICLYGVLLPAIISSVDTLWVVIGLVIAAMALPLFAVGIYASFKILKQETTNE